jgi:hypothetical protein
LKSGILEFAKTAKKPERNVPCDKDSKK